MHTCILRMVSGITFMNETEKGGELSKLKF